MPSNVSNWTEYGYGGTVNTDTWLPTISGNYGDNVASALRSRISAHPGGIDPDGVVWGTVDMAVWDSIRTSDNNIHVAKFARFKIRMTDISTSKAYGRFISWMGSGHDRGSDTDPVGPMVIVLR